MPQAPQRQLPDPKKQQSGPPRPPINPHLETQALLRSLIAKMTPVAELATQSNAPNRPDPFDTVVQLLQHLTGATDQILNRLETLEARMVELGVAKVAT